MRILTTTNSRIARRTAVVSTLLLVLTACGCSKTDARVQTRTAKAEQLDAIWFFDGAGGGGMFGRQGPVERGFRAAGFAGEFHHVAWQTGLGPLFDHDTDESYKREKAAEAAKEIRGHLRDHPESHVHIVAFSLGTALAVYTLEALPPSVRVDNMAMLGSHLSSTSDLTAPLRHVSGRVWFTVSPKDSVLKTVTAVWGNPKSKRERPIGLIGFLPGAEDTRKIRTLRWHPGFTSKGWHGSHIGVTSAEFVEKELAPRILKIADIDQPSPCPCLQPT